MFFPYLHAEIVLWATWLMSRRKTASPASSDRQPESDQQIEHWGLSRVSPDWLGLSESAVDEIIDYVFTDAATQSVVVSKGGYVVGERYAEGYDAISPSAG